jgi:hypothetical protein
MDHEENNKDGSTGAVVPLLGQFGRSLSNLFTRCATPGQVIVLSIDDITNGLGDEVEYLLDGNKRGKPIITDLNSPFSRIISVPHISQKPVYR